VVGVYASERHVEQTLWLSIAFEYDASEAVAVDQFERAIDYDSLSGALTKFIQQGKFQLIETTASASWVLAGTLSHGLGGGCRQ